LSKWIDAEFLKLYRMDRLSCDKDKWEFTARVVSSCKDILMPQIRISIHYHQQLYGDKYVMTYSCESLDKEYGIMYETSEKLRELFESVVADLVSKMKKVKLVFTYPSGYKEVK
jgi:hypothetical protein